MMSTSLVGMVGGGGRGALAIGFRGGGLGGENGRVMVHDFPKVRPQGLPCTSKTAGLGLSSTGM